MLYPTELRGQAVIAAADGFCQTDTLLARRPRVLVKFSPLSRSTGVKLRPSNKVVAVVDCETPRTTRDGRKSPFVLGRGHLGCDSA